MAAGRSNLCVCCRRFFLADEQVARGIFCTHEIFVSGQKVHRQRWARSCREVGEVIRLLVWAMDQGNLQGKDATR